MLIPILTVIPIVADLVFNLITHLTRRHTRAGGCPVQITLDSRLRGNDKRSELRKVS
jgi:hypothetical protein